jgi:putative addiction module CopG family antidote
MQMQIDLTTEEDAFVRRSVETGRHRRPEDAVREALELWIERERRREELLAAIDEGEASAAQGKVRIMPPGSARNLAEEVHQRGMARIAAKRSKHS